MPLAVAIGMTILAIIFLATNFSFFVALDVDQIKSSVAVAEVSFTKWFFFNHLINGTLLVLQEIVK